MKGTTEYVNERSCPVSPITCTNPPCCIRPCNVKAFLPNSIECPLPELGLAQRRKPWQDLAIGNIRSAIRRAKPANNWLLTSAALCCAVMQRSCGSGTTSGCRGPRQSQSGPRDESGTGTWKSFQWLPASLFPLPVAPAAFQVQVPVPGSLPRLPCST